MRTVEDDLKALGITGKELGRVMVDGKPFEAQKKRVVCCEPGDSVDIRLPIPPPELSPNARVHWAKKARAVKAQREAAKTEADKIDLWFERPTISLKFFHKRKRQHDSDNGISSTKGAVDGLVDGGLFSNDSKVHWGDVEFLVDKLDPHLILSICERINAN